MGVVVISARHSLKTGLVLKVPQNIRLLISVLVVPSKDVRWLVLYYQLLHLSSPEALAWKTVGG